ncbi:MAG TPA: DUF4388 domain-containing protein [bacterium]|nr:DUF4388 domain-containing protein [bacterium]
MALRGDLASVDLAQVFQMLALNKKVGLLSIQSAKLWKVLYFDQRGVTVHHNVHVLIDKVVAALVRTGRLDDEAVEEVRDHSVRMGQSLADSLLAGGYLDESELDYQYRLELEEEIYDLFFCRDARFEFHENVRQLDGRDGDIDERFFFNCDSIIMEAARRIDEWAYISERVPSTAEVLVATADEISAEEFGEDGPSIFELLDGRRNVARVVEITGLTNFQVCKVLSQLLDADKIAPVATDELIPLANECMDEGRLADAISLYERAIELEIGLPESHSLAAKAYQAAEEYEAAIFHLESEAEHRIGADDLAGAARCLLEVRQLVPTNLRARERLLELTVGPDAVRLDGFDALTEGKELVELLTNFGDLQRVRGVLERLLLVEPNDPDLKKALVNVHVRAGDQKRVIELYESIADDLVRQGKPLEAVSFLQKILVLDRSRSDVSERMRRLYEFDERARRRSRALSVLGGLFCLLLVLGSGYWFYNERAKEDFAAIDVQDLLAHDDFVGAAAVFRQFIEQHPLTTAVVSAEGELKRIASAQQVFEARRKAERAAREAELDKLRDRYRAEWNRYQEQLEARRPEQAFAAVSKVRDLLQDIDSARDTEWALEHQVENTWKNLRDYLAEARRLGAAYDEKVQAGEWAAAREVALRLQDEFEDTEAGRRVLVPVVVVTRPAGATLMHDGKPLLRKVDGRSVPVTTPGLVLCAAASPVRLTAELAGFEPREIVVDGRNDAQIDVVLEVVPSRVIAFEHPAQTGVGVGDGWLATALRGGRLGFARIDGTNRQEHELGGLKELAATPVVRRGRVFFVSNERTIECVPVSADVPVRGWPVPLEHDAATELGIGDGRIAVVDRKNVLHCWEQASGRRLWGIALGSAASGPPTIAHRKAYVGTVDGRVLVFDVTNGQSLSVLRSPAGLVTRVCVDRDLLVFGCSDDTVRAVDFRQGKVLWSETLARAPSDAGLALGRRIVLIADEGRVVARDRRSGAELAAFASTDKVMALAVDGGRALLQMRRSHAPRSGSHDVLVACALDTMEVLWEYALADGAPGAFGVGGSVVALPSPSGEVMLFERESAR